MKTVLICVIVLCLLGITGLLYACAASSGKYNQKEEYERLFGEAKES